MSDKKSATPIVGQNPRQQIIKKKENQRAPREKSEFAEWNGKVFKTE